VKGKVLVVDDEESILRLVSYSLEREGYEALTAADGNEALATIEAERPDLVILDLMLPGVDGLRFAGACVWRETMFLLLCLPPAMMRLIKCWDCSWVLMTTLPNLSVPES